MSTCYCENCRDRSAPGLVDAAPDLLAACEAICKYKDSLSAVSQGEFFQSVIFDEIRAAIAKAKSPLECKQCGDDHAIENCPRRCHLCGELGGDDDPPTHIECWEANDANQDIPVGEAAREKWAQDRKRAIEDSEDYGRGWRR